jgi:hypothetical protein
MEGCTERVYVAENIELIIVENTNIDKSIISLTAHSSSAPPPASIENYTLRICKIPLTAHSALAPPRAADRPYSVRINCVLSVS